MNRAYVPYVDERLLHILEHRTFPFPIDPKCSISYGKAEDL